MHIIKKILSIMFICFLVFCTNSRAFATTKVIGLNIDNSNSIMFLSTTNNTSTETLEPITLSAPNRTFFDIQDAILTQPNLSYFFQGSPITQIKLSQFSTNPNVVRIVFYHQASFSPNNLKVMNIKGNYFFKISQPHLQTNYYFNNYRESKYVSSDYLERTKYIPENEIAQNPLKSTIPTNTAQTIQKAFSTINETLNTDTDTPPPQATIPKNFNWSKVFKLKTKYYISKVDVKKGNNILLSGIGNVCVEKPIYLSNPNRVVFDLPNTIITQKFKNVEVWLSSSESLKIGQFEPAKVRVVITTPNFMKYQPIYSQDLQGLLLANSDAITNIKLAEHQSNILSFKVSEYKNVDTFQINFDKPVIHSIINQNNKVELSVYNVNPPEVTKLQNAIKYTNFSDTKTEKLQNGLRFTFPVQNNSKVENYFSIDARSIKVQITNKTTKEKVTPQPKKSGKYLIVIDPGHGGGDTGALKAGINEKDLNLTISKMVEQILKSKGYNVLLTRKVDETLSLQDRVEFSDSNEADLFVSIHSNSTVREDVSGIETHWWKDDSTNFADTVHKSLTSKIKTVDRGLFKSKFYVINHTHAKSILVEVGFISNENERNELLTKERQQKTAQAIADGIIKYIRSESKK